MEYYPVCFLVCAALASHIASTTSQGLNPDFVKHLNEKVSNSLKQKSSQYDDPWSDNEEGDALCIIDGLAGALKDFGKKRGKMVIDGRELEYETHYRLHSLDAGWVHDCEITDIASGVTLELRHRKGEQQVIKEAVEKLFQELQTKGLVLGRAEGNTEEADKSPGLHGRDQGMESPPIDAAPLPGSDVTPAVVPNPVDPSVRDGEKPDIKEGIETGEEVQTEQDVSHAEGERETIGESESVSTVEKDKDSLPRGSETISSDEDIKSWSKLLKIVTHQIASNTEMFLPKIVLCVLFVIAGWYILKKKSGPSLQTSIALTRLLVDEIEPDGDGLYIHRMISQATPTLYQLDVIRNYDSMYRFRKKGLVYILNNYIFYKRSPGTVGRERKGSEIDLQNVKHLFTQLGYEPVVDKDLKADEIRHSLDSLVERINSEGAEVHSSLVVFLMSHGTTRGILGTDELEVSIEEIMDRLSGKRCRALVEKPKILFLQACRGRNLQQSAVDGELKLAEYDKEPAESIRHRGVGTDDGIFPTSKPDQNQSLDIDNFIPDNTDIYVAFATSHGYFSVRDTVHGSWFVQATCEEFIAAAHVDDLDTMMESVTRRVTQLWGKMKLRSGEEVTMLQTPDIRKQGVRRKIYFAPQYPTSCSASR